MALTNFLTEIKTKIESILTAQNISGYTVKRGEMAHKPDKQISLHAYAGNAPELGFGREGLQYESPGLQISVRGSTTDYDGPLVVIDTIWEELVKVQDEVLSGQRYLIIRANQHPFLGSRDGDQRCVFKVNFICEREV